MLLRFIPVLGVLVAVALFGVATSRYPGGYDWNRDLISTLLRDNPAHRIPSSARLPAIVGMLIFCASIGLVFERLARGTRRAHNAKAIRIGGIGSMVYASLAFTPMHDLMVNISLIFFVIAVLALLQVLYVKREIGFLVTGCACFATLLASAAIYYAQFCLTALPWAQRATFAMFVVWLLALQFSESKGGAQRNDPA